MRVLVCGGRNYSNRDKVADVLGYLNPRDGNGITCVIHGGALGADALAAEWAIKHDITCASYAADWRTQGRAAGPIRNSLMLREGKPDVVVAFPGGRGTADMMAKARAAGVQVIEVNDPAHRPTPTGGTSDG